MSVMVQLWFRLDAPRRLILPLPMTTNWNFQAVTSMQVTMGKLTWEQELELKAKQGCIPQSHTHIDRAK